MLHDYINQVSATWLAASECWELASPSPSLPSTTHVTDDSQVGDDLQDIKPDANALGPLGHRTTVLADKLLCIKADLHPVVEQGEKGRQRTSCHKYGDESKLQDCCAEGKNPQSSHSQWARGAEDGFCELCSAVIVASPVPLPLPTVPGFRRMRTESTRGICCNPKISVGPCLFLEMYCLCFPSVIGCQHHLTDPGRPRGTLY